MKKVGLLGLVLSAMTFASVAAPLTFSLNRIENDQAVKVNEKSFDNKYLLIAVGYTGCPDICPTTLLDMRNALKTLDETPEQVKKLQPLFITIDPESDTLKDITQYTGFFDSRIVGLRADNFELLDDVVKQLSASYGYTFEGKPVLPPNLPKGYTVMHSIYMYLYSPTGELLDVFPYNMDGKTLAQNLLKYIQ